MSTGSKIVLKNRVSKKTGKRIEFIDNPIQVQGFNVQRITMPPHSYGYDVPEKSKDWIHNIDKIALFRQSQAKKEKRAIYLGIGIGTVLFSLWLGFLYAMGA